MAVMVTGCAGFIGMHVAQALLLQGERVVGIDNLNDYYDVNLKKARLKLINGNEGFIFKEADIADMESLAAIFKQHEITGVVHLAAQAGVRYSIQNPHAYSVSNLTGFLNILEACRGAEAQHLVYASSSSVYGGNIRMPFHEEDPVDHPVSLYAATKKANELMAHTYSHLYGLPTTGLRFFTVYGPWGRPDMSPTLFARAIFEDRSIDVFNYGKMKRDFTYIDDIVEAVVRVLNKPATTDVTYDPMTPKSYTSNAPWRIFNIGNHQPVNLLEYIEIMERAIGRLANKNMKPMQAGDVLATCADTEALQEWIGFSPATTLEVGIGRFVEWVRQYYGY